MNEQNNQSNDNRAPEKNKFQFYKKYAFFLFWLVLAVVVAVYIIFNGTSIVQFLFDVLGMIQPILFGLVIAYLLNPSVKFFEKTIFKPLTCNMKNQKRAQGLSRGFSITLSIVMFILVITILLNMVIPELYNSIVKLVTSVPDQLRAFTEWLSNYLKSGDNVSKYIQMGIDSFTDFFPKWLQSDLLPTINTTVSSVTVGVIEVVKTFINFFIGIIISIYVLISKEKFTGQAKKFCYSVMKPNKANIFLDTTRKSNDIFIGFISGKLVDSLIMGVLCFIGCSILQMPYTMLVSVVVGVTNIIPFFGPYMGAIPSILLILLEDPIKGVTFAFFIICLQQLDGNIIGPKILGDSTGLSPFWVVFSILLGGGLFGFIGMLIGVPTFAVIYYIIGQIVSHRLRKKDLPTVSDNYVDVKSINSTTGDLEYFSNEQKQKSGYFSKIFKKKNPPKEESNSSTEDSNESDE